jgi:glycosyltransferase involved in cell wall biosynthesis
MPSVQPSLSIVIPAYNEAERLPRSLGTVLEYLSGVPGSELIVVDDGSTDDTVRVAEQCFDGCHGVSTRLLRTSVNRGKGHAVRTGLLAARAPVGVFTDADLSTPITELPKLLDPLLRGDSDVTFGSRALDRRLIGVHQPWLRETGGRVFNLVVRGLTGLPIWDTQCGFKAFRLSRCRPILEVATIDRFGFDVEWLYVAHRAGLRLQEIPVRWNHCEGSTVSLRRDSLRMIDDIRLIRQQAAAGVYNRAIDDTVGTTVPLQEPNWEARLRVCLR